MPHAGNALPLQLALFPSAECAGPPAPFSTSPSSSTAATRPPRRGRSRPLPAGGWPTASFPRPASGGFLAAPARLAAASSLAFFSSCLRRCSESGLLPARPVVMASVGSLISGFCGVGSAGLARAGGCKAEGTGANLSAGDCLSRFQVNSRRRFSFSRLLLLAAGFSERRRQHRTFPRLAPARAMSSSPAEGAAHARRNGLLADDAAWRGAGRLDFRHGRCLRPP